MKKNKLLYKAYALLMLLFITSCADRNHEGEQGMVNPEEGLPISATLDTRSIPGDLTCKLYVFWKPSNSTEYICKETVVLDNQLPYRMKFSNQELTGKSYRFLFVAFPLVNSQLKVYNNEDQDFEAESSLADLTIRASGEMTDGNYYYGIVDKTGEEILNTGTIRGELQRIVGQIVLDVFRINTRIDEPMHIQTSTIASVLDRVHQIDIKYTNLTKELSINNAGELVAKTSWDTPVQYTISPDLGDTLQVYIPQKLKGLEISGLEVNGSVRIKGVYGLPSSTVRAQYIFKYYDTTPVCGDTGGSHSAGCFDDQRTLTLNLPQLSEEEKLLSIIPNNYTVNKAGIRLDRIIDLKVSSAFELQMAWDNENEISNE